MLQTYREKQHQRYLDALALGQRHMAVDALWRAASEADLLATDEVNGDKLTTERIVYLLDRLGWA